MRRCVWFSVLMLTAFSAAAVPAMAKPFEVGLALDCARRYFSADELERYIDFLAGYEGSFLQLHLTDHENVGLELETLGQTAAFAVRDSDGTVWNPKTGKPFLTKAQLTQLGRYAEARGVELVPEIDFPGHAGGFYRLARVKFGAEIADRLFIDTGGGTYEANLSDAGMMTLIRAVYSEAAAIFPRSTVFHIGCDEVFSASDEEIGRYIAQIADFVRDQGFAVRIWNDSLTKANLRLVPPDLEVTYWSFDGDAEDESERAERRRARASLPELLDAGFAVLNFNSYYLYYVPSAGDSETDLTMMVGELRDGWRIEKWDGTAETSLSPERVGRIVGAGVSVWTEDSAGVADETIFVQSQALVSALREKIRPADNSSD